MHFEKNSSCSDCCGGCVAKTGRTQQRLKQAKEETKNAPDLGSFALLRAQVWAQYLSLPYIKTENTKELLNDFNLGCEETRHAFSFILKFLAACFSNSCATASLIS